VSLKSVSQKLKVRSGIGNLADQLGFYLTSAPKSYKKAFSRGLPKHRPAGTACASVAFHWNKNSKMFSLRAEIEHVNITLITGQSYLVHACPSPSLLQLPPTDMCATIHPLPCGATPRPTVPCPLDAATRQNPRSRITL
jgi:hypothetical protein